MKKIVRIVLVVMVSLILLMNNVNAECDDKTRLEINSAASNVTADLEMVKKVIDLYGVVHPEVDEKLAYVTGSGYAPAMFSYINVNNISDKIYLNFANDDDNVNEIIDLNAALNGKWQYEVPDVSKIRTYTIKIFSNVDGCSDEEIRTISIKSPMYNTYSESRLCENNDAYYCQEYVTTPIDMDVIELMWQKENESSNNNSNSEAENVNENSNFKKILLYIGTGVAIIIVIAIIVLIIMRINKKRKDKKYMELGV